MLYFFSMILFSCDDDSMSIDDTDENSMSQTLLKIRLTDAPKAVDAVNIDIREVIVKTSNNDEDSVSIETNAGIYDLLQLQNGIDTLFASSYIQADSITQIRLILGPNNTIVVDGEEVALSTPSAEQSGLKIKTNLSLSDSVEFTVLIDFDADKSIVETGNGKYKLKPVLKLLKM